MAVALKEVGVEEVGGNNRGPRVKEYLASVNLPEGNPWCAAYVHWCYRECGVVLEPARSYAMALKFHEKPKRVWERGGWTYEPGEWKRISKDGDHFALWYDNLGRIGHTGLIRGEDEKWVLTVEGNTSSGGSREGDAVYLRKRLKRTLYCISRHPIPSNDGQPTHMGDLRGVPRVQPRQPS